MRDFMSVRQVARHLNVSPRTITRYINKGILPAVRIGRVWRISPDEIDRFIQRGGIDLRQNTLAGGHK